MTAFSFGPLLAYDPTTGTLLPSAAGQVYAVTDTSFTTPLAMTDLSGTTKGSLNSDVIGILDEFVVEDNPEVNWKSGSYIIRLSSFKGVLAVATAAQASADATSAQVALLAAQLDDADAVLPAGGVQGVDVLWRGALERTGIWAPLPVNSGGGGGAVDWSAIANVPTTFPPSGHTHPAVQISDSTALGRQLLQAASAIAVRTLIGAGTGNGTSDLQLGSTGTTAAAGNHAHTASQVSYAPSGGITATDVQTAVAQAAQLGGGGTGAAAPVQVWRYTAGAWPPLPATKPVGVQMYNALGPTYPTVVPSWMGNAADKIPMRYSKVPVA